MKALFDRKQLAEAFTVAAGVAPTRHPRTILTGVKMVATAEGTVALAATDVDLGVTLAVAGVKVDEPGAVVLPTAHVAKILGTTDDAELSLATDGTTLTVRGLRSKFELAIEDAALFPAIPEPDGDAIVRAARAEDGGGDAVGRRVDVRVDAVDEGQVRSTAMPRSLPTRRPYTAAEDAAVRTAVCAGDYARIAEEIGRTRASVEERSRRLNHRLPTAGRPGAPGRPRRRADDDDERPINHAALAAAAERWERAAARDDNREFRRADNALGLILSRVGPYQIHGFVYRYDAGSDGVVRNVAARRYLAG